MRIPHIRLSTLASLTLGFLYACTDNSGLSLNRDGALAATGGTTTATGGTKGGLGGATSATGGAGGRGTGAGGKTSGTGGTVIDAGASRDAPIDVMCGPVCLIYCPFGNKVDSNGCPACTCNPDPQLDGGVDAKPIDTKPILCPAIACAEVFCENGYVTDANGCPTCTCKPGSVVCPVLKCKACASGYLKDSNGCDTCTCAPDPGPACDSLVGESACNTFSSRCKWLTPGCGTPALSASGCHDQLRLNCTSSCPAGLTCLQRWINPCFNAPCDACGQQIGICL